MAGEEMLSARLICWSFAARTPPADTPPEFHLCRYAVIFGICVLLFSRCSKIARRSRYGARVRLSGKYYRSTPLARDFARNETRGSPV